MHVKYLCAMFCAHIHACLKTDDWDGSSDLALCGACQHPVVVCHDIVGYLLEHCRMSKIKPEDVLMFKFCVDGGGQCCKYMCLLLTRADPLLRV